MKRYGSRRFWSTLVVAGLVLITGCRDGAQSAAELQCSLSPNFTTAEENACAHGVQMARNASEKLTLLSSVREVRATLSVVRRDCDKTFADDLDLVGACYAGVDHFIDRLAAERRR